tara:strand:- start:348 stop:764 length:417 start_codon:yes stop_codon:yes gene_type:complete
MPSIDQLQPLLPFIGICIGTCIVLSHLLAMRAVKKLQRQHDSQLKKLETNISVLTTGALGMGQKTLVLEATIKKLQKAQEEFKQSDVEFSYTQAQKLISQGVGDDAVAANSGLSATEINLMRMLQSQSHNLHAVANHA